MDGYITIGTQLDTKEFDQQIAQLEREIEQIEKDLENAFKGGLAIDSKPIRRMQVDLEKARNKLVGLYQQKMKLQNSGGFDKIESSLSSMTKKAGRFVVAIFGIRSAYLGLMRASNSLASYDQQYAANLEYIKYVLTQTIAPVLKWIVSAVGTVLQYIYAILEAWFGIASKLNLSAESFNKMKAGASGVSKAVKEIKKDLLGFDEINRLTDQSSTGTSAGAGGVGIPDFDIGGLGNIPEWLQWIIDNKQIVLDILATIAAIIASIKIAQFLTSFKTIFNLFSNMANLKTFGLIAGLAITIAGIVQTIQALIKFINNPSWSNFIDVLNGIQTALIGVSIALLALNASNPVGWIILAVAVLIEYIKQLTEDKAQILSVADAQKQLTEAINETRRAENEYVNAIENTEKAEKELTRVERLHQMSGEELYKSFKNGTLTYQNMNEAQREVLKAYMNSINAQSELEKATEKLTEANHNQELQNLKTALSVAKETGNYEEFKEKVIEAYDTNKIKVEEARDLIERSVAEMSASATIAFVQDIPKAIKEGFDPTRYKNLFQKFTAAMESLFLSIKNGLKNAFNINFSVGSSSSSFSGRAKGGIFYPSMLPKLAVGGIINQPGTGTFYNGAIIGERGAEAVVPLTDTQQMELLGETIGRYITINANIVNTMNGRVISRELKQVQNEQEFAYNT